MESRSRPSTASRRLNPGSSRIFHRSGCGCSSTRCVRRRGSASAWTWRRALDGPSAVRGLANATRLAGWHIVRGRSVRARGSASQFDSISLLCFVRSASRATGPTGKPQRRRRLESCRSATSCNRSRRMPICRRWLSSRSAFPRRFRSSRWSPTRTQVPSSTSPRRSRQTAPSTGPHPKAPGRCMASFSAGTARSWNAPRPGARATSSITSPTIRSVTTSVDSNEPLSDTRSLAFAPSSTTRTKSMMPRVSQTELPLSSTNSRNAADTISGGICRRSSAAIKIRRAIACWRTTG